MKKQRRLILSILVSTLLLGILVGYAPWPKVAHILSNLRAVAIITLLLLGTGYYSLKCLRFWIILRAMDIQKPLSLVALSYMASQPLSLLPAGEIFRSHSLRRYTGVPVKQSSPQFLLQGLFEALAMAILLVVSSLAQGTLRVAALCLMLVVSICVIGVKSGYIASIGKIINRLPFIHLSEHAIEHFSHNNRRVLTRQWMPKIILLSLAIELIGSAIAFVAVKSVHGDIEFYEATLIYIIPVIAGFITLLPGGIGISEQTAVGLLLLDHNTIGVAVAGVVLMRITIVLLGVLLGILVIVSEKFWHISPVYGNQFTHK